MTFAKLKKKTKKVRESLSHAKVSPREIFPNKVAIVLRGFQISVEVAFWRIQKVY